MSIRYVVKPGDHLAKIAAAHGIHNHMALWKSSENANLRAKRKNPNVLFAGDVVTIPDKTTKHADAATEQRHRFTTTGARLILRIDVENAFHSPLMDAPCELAVEGASAAEQQTNDSGRVELDIPRPTERAQFVIRNAETTFADTVLNVIVGGLDPLDTLEGQSQRLVNLGYLSALPENRDALEFLSAVQEFQCDHGLAVDGRCGPVTQAKLEKVHGS